ncbi:MAG: hypothetical protein WCE87_13495 [Candidatus Udaeobacter sp.]
MRLIFLFVFASALICNAEDKATGRWEGTVQIPARELEVVVDLAKAETGLWQGSIIIPRLNLPATQLVDIAVQDSDASFGIKTGRGLDAALKGHFNADGTLSGNFMQAGNRAAFTLKKTGAPQVEAPSRSTPVTKEIEGEWKGEYQIFGTPRHVTLKLTNGAENDATAEFVVVGRKVNNLPVDLVTQEGDLLTIESNQTGISYEGRFNKEANEIKGTFMQGPIELPLVLRKSK